MSDSFVCFVCDVEKPGSPRLEAEYNSYNERIFVGLNPKDLTFCDDCTDQLFEWINSRRK